MKSKVPATESPVWTAKSAPFRNPRRATFGAAMLLAIAAGVVGLDAASTSNVVPATRQFEAPQENSPWKREEMQRIARENNERHRFHIELPAAAFDAPEETNTLRRAGHYSQIPDSSDQFSPGDLILWLPKSVWVLLGAAVWILLARKFAPEVLEMLTGWLRSRSLLPSVSTKQLVTVLAEEKAVAEFQAAMQSSATDPGALPETGAISSASGHVREVRRLLQ